MTLATSIAHEMKIGFTYDPVRRMIALLFLAVKTRHVEDPAVIQLRTRPQRPPSEPPASRSSATTTDSSKFVGVHGLGMHIDGGVHGL